MWNVDCLGSPATALVAVVGTPSASGSAANGDVVVISGICTEDVTVTQNGLTITNDQQRAAYLSSDGVQGQLEIDGAKSVLVIGLLLGTASGSFNFGGAGDAANLHVCNGASALIEYCGILSGPLDGLMVTGNSAMQIASSTIVGNGTAGDVAGFGIRAEGRSAVALGSESGGQAVTVSDNGGNGIAAIGGSSLDLFDAVISDNGAYQGSLLGNSTAHLTSPSIVCAGTVSGNTCLPAGNLPAAIAVAGSSGVRIEGGAAVTRSAAAQALLVLGGSSALLQGSVFA